MPRFNRPRNTDRQKTPRRTQEQLLAQFSEDVVHDFLFKTGLSDLVDDTDAFDDDDATGDEEEFQLWRIIRARALAVERRRHFRQ
jgi:hypothetical protein